MIKPGPKTLRCAVYTRVSTEHGLEQDFNLLSGAKRNRARVVNVRDTGTGRFSEDEV